MIREEKLLIRPYEEKNDWGKYGFNMFYLVGNCWMPFASCNPIYFSPDKAIEAVKGLIKSIRKGLDDFPDAENYTLLQIRVLLQENLCRSV